MVENKRIFFIFISCHETTEKDDLAGKDLVSVYLSLIEL